MDDPRDDSTVKTDFLADQIISLAAVVDKLARRDGQHQTVIHKTTGPGGLLAAAITACACTLVLMIIVTAVLLHELARSDAAIRDLQAWEQVHQNDIAGLKARSKP